MRKHYLIAPFLSIFFLTTPVFAEKVEIQYYCNVLYQSNISGYSPAPYSRQCTSTAYFLINGIIPNKIALSCTVKRGESQCEAKSEVDLPDGTLTLAEAYTSPDLGTFEKKRKCAYSFGIPAARLTPLGFGEERYYAVNSIHEFSCAESLAQPRK